MLAERMQALIDMEKRKHINTPVLEYEASEVVPESMVVRFDRVEMENHFPNDNPKASQLANSLETAYFTVVYHTARLMTSIGSIANLITLQREVATMLSNERENERWELLEAQADDFQGDTEKPSRQYTFQFSAKGFSYA